MFGEVTIQEVYANHQLIRDFILCYRLDAEYTDDTLEDLDMVTDSVNHGESIEAVYEQQNMIMKGVMYYGREMYKEEAVEC